ncbi:MAG: hypothetical protein P1V51_01780 [Deltaproteobacteria bacterium]|nr:hypothetical protein [Deltaproteobacteria bacterium]
MISRLRELWRKAGAAVEAGQASSEYAIISAMILGGGALSWPFLIDLLEAMNTYYGSIYAAIQCPIP